MSTSTRLTVKRLVGDNVVLEGDDGLVVILPGSMLPDGTGEGDEVEVVVTLGRRAGT